MIQNAFKIKNGLIVDGDSQFNGFLQFNTGYTATSAPARLYFDNTENALTYFPVTSNLDVAVNIGQESIIRVYNNSGIQINNGQVVTITGSTNGLPSITLANASKDSISRVFGVATHNIPNNSNGFITNFGIVRDIDLSQFRPGDNVFLSDVVDGGLIDSDASNIKLTSRVNSVGVVIMSGITGKLLVNIENENLTESLTSKEKNILAGNVSSTGLFQYTGITKTSDTTFQVSPAFGWVILNTNNYSLEPNILFLNYSGSTTGTTTPYLTTSDATYVLLTTATTLSFQSEFPSPEQRRLNIYLGKVIHPNRTSILNINNSVDYDVSPMSALRDLWTPIKLINENIVVSPNGNNLNINTSAGKLWGNGIGWVTNQLNPNSISIPSNSPASFYYRTQTGGTSSLVTTIDPTKYDVNGIITSIGGPGNNDATNQRVYLYPSGVINILYGQTKYPNLAAAVAGIQTESFITYPNAQTTGILIGIISVRNDIVADGQPLTNTNYAIFTQVSKFGELLGGTGGLSTTTLQQAYDNSNEPEIITNSTLGSITFKRGSSSDSDNVLEIQDGSGITNVSINASGRTTTKSLTVTNLNISNSDRFLVVNNSGDTSYRSDVVLQSDFNTYTANTQTEINLNSIYNTVLSPSLSMPVSVGGISSGTTVSQLSGLTFTSLFDDLLFPTVLPTYTIPTITIGGVSNSTVEVGSTITPSITLSSVKNDAGVFTQLRILRNSSPIFTNTGLTISWSSPVSDQFGFPNANMPNSGFTINPTPYSESYTIPGFSAGTSSSTTYRGDGNYNQGLPKKNNKNVNDTRGFLLRSTTAPQSGGTVSLGTQIDSSTVTYTGIYPYFYGISATLPTPTTISHAISGGTATKVLSSASGTLSIPYNTTGNYIWVAYFNNYTTKTKWYVTALDNGNLDGSFLTSATTQNINSPNGFWGGVTYKLHWSVNATSQSTLEYRNS